MKILSALILAAALGGCTALLPTGRQQTVTGWETFEDAKAAFDRIEPYRTTLDELHALGYDAERTPNVAILNYSQVVRTVLPHPTFSVDEQPQGIRDCLRAEARCFGYALEQSRLERARTGGFLADFLNFRRETLITGWRFSALVAVVDGVVVYKQWSGQPHVRQTERSHNPLGPLQEAGGSRGLFSR